MRAETLGSLGLGSPVYYRRLDVGDVIAYDLAKDGRSMEIRIFVNAPYDKFVTADTRFWEASGIDASMGADGLSLRTASVTSLIAGGIAFETPSAARPTKAAPNTVFTLFKDRKTALAPTLKESERFVIRFNESLRGLSVGAPVHVSRDAGRRGHRYRPGVQPGSGSFAPAWRSRSSRTGSQRP